MSFLLLSLLFFAIHYGFQGLFLSHLKRHHSDVYKKIAYPTMFTNYYLQKTDAYSVFMHDKGWQALNDKHLNIYHVTKQIFLAISIACFVAGFFFEL